MSEICKLNTHFHKVIQRVEKRNGNVCVERKVDMFTARNLTVISSLHDFSFSYFFIQYFSTMCSYIFHKPLERINLFDC